jgi:hypothetical protein
MFCFFTRGLNSISFFNEHFFIKRHLDIEIISRLFNKLVFKIVLKAIIKFIEESKIIPTMLASEISNDSI